MSLFGFLRDTMSGGHEAYASAVSSELDNYKKRRAIPYELADMHSLASDRRNDAIDKTKRQQAMEQNTAAVEGLAKSRTAVALPSTSYNAGPYTDPAMRSMAPTTPPTAGGGEQGTPWIGKTGTDTPSGLVKPTTAKQPSTLAGDIRSAIETRGGTPGMLVELRREETRLLRNLEQTEAALRKRFDQGGFYGYPNDPYGPLQTQYDQERLQIINIRKQINSLEPGGVEGYVPGSAGNSLTKFTGEYAPQIEEAAKVAGTSPGYFQTMIGVESGGNPSAKNPNSSATGILQFTAPTAAQYGLTDPTDPVASLRAGGEFTRDNVNALTKALGRSPTERELYLAHQQGATGATKLLTAGDSNKASAIVGKDAVVLNGGTEDMTAGQFAEHVMQMYDRKQAAMGMTPVEALQSGVGAPGMNTDVYMQEPERLSLDLQITNQYQAEIQTQYANLQRYYDTISQMSAYGNPGAYMETIVSLDNQMMEVRLAAAQSMATEATLYAYQGLNLAQGGKTGLLSSALSTITGAQYEIIPYEGGFYTINVGGQPINAEPMAYDALVIEVRQRVDSGYAEALMTAQAEAQSDMALERYKQQGALQLKQLEIGGAIAKEGAQMQRELSVQEAARERGFVPTKESTPDSEAIFKNPNTGQLYVLTPEMNKGKPTGTHRFVEIAPPK